MNDLLRRRRWRWQVAGGRGMALCMGRCCWCCCFCSSLVCRLCNKRRGLLCAAEPLLCLGSGARTRRVFGAGHAKERRKERANAVPRAHNGAPHTHRCDSATPASCVCAQRSCTQQHTVSPSKAAHRHQDFTIFCFARVVQKVHHRPKVPKGAQVCFCVVVVLSAACSWPRCWRLGSTRCATRLATVLPLSTFVSSSFV